MLQILIPDFQRLTRQFDCQDHEVSGHWNKHKKLVPASNCFAWSFRKRHLSRRHGNPYFPSYLNNECKNTPPSIPNAARRTWQQKSTTSERGGKTLGPVMDLSGWHPSPSRSWLNYQLSSCIGTPWYACFLLVLIFRLSNSSAKRDYNQNSEANTKDTYCIWVSRPSYSRVL